MGLRRQPGRLALAVFRLPLVLYQRGWGGLLGGTFLLLVHAGRKTGKLHQVVAMVLRYDPETGEAVICSAWGQDADWIRNIRAHPAVRVQIGRNSFIPKQRFLADDEGVAVMAEFQRRHRAGFASCQRFWAGEISTRTPPHGISSAPGHSSPCDRLTLPYLTTPHNPGTGPWTRALAHV